MSKVNIQIDTEVQEKLREVAGSSWEPYNETIRMLLGMPPTTRSVGGRPSSPTVGQGEGELEDGHDA